MAECEGFICPLCMRDFRGVLQLEQHFQEEHSDTTQSRFRSNLKNLFGKLKRKNQDGGMVDEGAAAASSKVGVAGGVVTNVSGFDESAPQPLGYNRDLMRDFRRERDHMTAQLAAETNRLIIRVERLFKALQVTQLRTAKARKELEQSVVTWRPDKEEKRCRYCGRGFNVRRRKHHCRLCGGILCHQCSYYMSLSETYPVLSDSPEFESLAPPQRTKLLSSLKRGRGKKSGRVGEEEEEEEEEDQSNGLRMCSYCHKLMHRRINQLQKLEKPLLTSLYERMQSMIGDADERKPPYLIMADSLVAGDHGYRLQDAMMTRQELIKVYEAIDRISKDIFSLAGDITTDPSASRANFKLCRCIRAAASVYLQDNLLALPSLPSPHQLAELRQRKEEEAKERLRVIERQRELQRQQEIARNPPGNFPRSTMEPTSAMADIPEEDERGIAGASGVDAVSVEKKKRFEKLKNLSNKVIPKVNFKKEGGGGGGEGGGVTLGVASPGGGGWMSRAKSFGSVDSQDDPFSLQREQLLGYIEQARAAGRSDEVAALEQSLFEIEKLIIERADAISSPPPPPFSAHSLSYGFT